MYEGVVGRGVAGEGGDADPREGPHVDGGGGRPGDGGGDVRGGLRAVGRVRARLTERAHHAGGLPRHRVGRRVQLRGRAGVGTWMAHSGHYCAETVFFRRSLPVINISVRDMHSSGVSKSYGMCFLQQSDLNMFAILQTRNRAEVFYEAG